MGRTSLITMLVALISSSAFGAVGFNDLTLATHYSVDDSFTSSGVLVTVSAFQSHNGTWYSSGAASVSDYARAGGSGYEMWMGNVNLEFHFGQISGLSLVYAELGGNLNISINGALRNILDLPEIDGQTIGGVLAHVTSSPCPGGYRGSLTLEGPLTSFSIGGQEFAIDDVSPVPEPGGLLTLAGGLAFAIVTTRRRHTRKGHA